MDNTSNQTSRSIFKNVIYGFSTWILPLGLSFIATPIIVKALGNEDYGIYALILGFISYSFNFNTGRAITKYVAEYRIKGESRKIYEVISATLLLNIIGGLFSLITISLAANWLVADVFQITEPAREKTVLAFYISAAIIFILMQNQVFNSILQGLQRYDIYSKIFNTNSFFVLSGNIVLALSGYGLLHLLLWNLLILIITTLMLVFISRKLLGGFKFSFQITRQTLYLILTFSGGVISYQILANFFYLFERGWIIRNFGEEGLTFYVVPMLLGIYLHSFISSLLQVLFPLASELTSERGKLKKLYLRINKYVGFCVVFIAVTLIVNSFEFLTLWMGKEFAGKSDGLLILHIISFSLIAIPVAAWFITEGLGYPYYNSAVYLICVTIGLILMIILTGDYGSYGVALGRLAGFFIVFCSMFYVEKWFFKEIQIKFWIKLFITLGLAAAFSGFLEKLILANLSLTWMTFLLSVLIGGLGYVVVLLLLGFIDEEDKLLLKKILSR